MPIAPLYPSDVPRSELLEVSVFGPGVGECILLHVGSGQWVVVDSCLGDSGEPVALEYLHALGVSPSAISHIVATHWHDDHIRGLAEVLSAAPNAEFVCSQALRIEEFFSLLATSAELRKTTRLPSGVDEMKSVLEDLKRRGRSPTWASDVQTLLRSGNLVVTSLSPSSATCTRSFLGFAALLPRVKSARKVVPNVRPNETSVVLHVEFNKAVVLLGADLEITSAPNAGWQAIVGSNARPTARASVYKVAHHGSETGHLHAIWSVLLDPRPHAVITPFTRSDLPRATDLDRLASLSGQIHQTAPSRVHALRRDRAVTRTLATIAKRPPTPRRGRMGQVRLRLDPATGAVLTTEAFGAAFEVPRSA